MGDQKKFLVDVEMRDLPFPMKVLSKVEPEGQHTVANISVSARIMQGFEARWIDTFIRILHQHRDSIGTRTLRTNIVDYTKELSASSVRVDFHYPYFVEKLTPISREKCLVRYFCTYSAKAVSVKEDPKIIFKIKIPCITTYPGSVSDKPGGLFGQLSNVIIEMIAQKDFFAEDLVEIVDDHALSPIYSFLSEDDQASLIQRIHSEKKSSVVLTDEIKHDLRHHQAIEWYAVRCTNYGMLHSYNTVVGTEKSYWVPFSGYEKEI
jgi:GTP cyclohydrolase I